MLESTEMKIINSAGDVRARRKLQKKACDHTGSRWSRSMTIAMLMSNCVESLDRE